MPTAEQFTPSITEHGEGPVWDAAASRLLCVDLERGDLLSLDPSEPSGVRKTNVDAALGALRPRAGGGWVMGLQRRFGLLDTGVEALMDGASSVRKLTELWPEPTVRMNDGGCDPQGRFFCGSMAYDKSPGGGTLWRLDADGTAQVVLRDVSISNGIGWSPSGERAYYIDTPTRRVDVLLFDPATGNLLTREPFVTVPEGPGMPDGLTVDAEGGVWVALWGGGGVLRYSADGELTERVDVPTPQTTAMTFGGDDLRTVFITTSTQGLDPGSDERAGALFRYEAPVAGLPPLPFGG